MNTSISAKGLIGGETFRWMYGLRRVLLTCGIFSSLVYVFINIISPLYYPGYNIASQTVSELSAIDAPSRKLWVSVCSVYSLLVLLFAAGIWLSAYQDKRLVFLGALMAIYAISGFFWPPMHQREVIAAGGATLTDTMHIVFAFITILLMMFMVGLGAAVLGRRFRIYSIISMIFFVLFGTLTGLDGPKISENLPTPFIGVWERINIGIFMLWMIVIAVTLITRIKKNVIA